MPCPHPLTLAPSPSHPLPPLPILPRYRTILSCLVLVLRGCRASLWSRAGGDAGALGGDSLAGLGSQAWDDGGQGGVVGSLLGRGGLGDALMSAFGCVVDEATQKSVLLTVHVLLDVLAVAPTRVAREMYPLLSFLMHQVRHGVVTGSDWLRRKVVGVGVVCPARCRTCESCLSGQRYLSPVGGFISCQCG